MKMLRVSPAPGCSMGSPPWRAEKSVRKASPDSTSMAALSASNERFFSAW